VAPACATARVRNPGRGEVVLCGHDPLTGQDYRDTTISAPADAVIEEATRLHRDRYGVADQICLAEVNPRALAVVIDNTDFS
jgi:uridine kinase